MTIVFALLLVAHGIAHLVGFAVPWGLIAAPDLANQTTPGMKLLGIVWLLLAIGFVAAGGVLLAGRHEATWLMILAAISLLFCIVAWPETRIGLVVNAGILAALFVFPQLSRV